MDYTEWTPQDLGKQLKTLGFGIYQKNFISHEIAGAHLPLITEDDLEEIGITKVGHRILLMRRFSDIMSGKITPNIPLQRNSMKQTEEAEVQKTPKSRGRMQEASSARSKASQSRNNYNSNSTKYDEDENAFTVPAMPRNRNTHKNETSPIDTDDIYSLHSKQSSSQSSDYEVSRRPMSQNIEEEPIQLKQTVRSHREHGLASSRESQNINDATENKYSRQVSSTSNLNASNIPAPDKSGKIKCPYCGRTYIESAAKKHIPVCGRINATNRH